MLNSREITDAKISIHERNFKSVFTRKLVDEDRD